MVAEGGGEIPVVSDCSVRHFSRNNSRLSSEAGVMFQGSGSKSPRLNGA